MEEITQDITQVEFDYSVLDTETQIFLKSQAFEISSRMKRTAEDIIAIGSALIAVKKRIGHGRFEQWIQSEFEMSSPSAQRFMAVSRRFSDKNVKLMDLTSSVLYALAAPSTPDTIVEKVVEKEIPANVDAIRKAKEEARKEAQKEFEREKDKLEIDVRQRVAAYDDEIQDLQAQIAHLQELPQPTNQTREQMASLHKKIDSLQHKNKLLAEENEVLGEQARLRAMMRHDLDYAEEVRWKWRNMVGEVRKLAEQKLLAIPDGSDACLLNSDSIAYFHEMKTALQLFIANCEKAVMTANGDAPNEPTFITGPVVDMEWR